MKDIFTIAITLLYIGGLINGQLSNESNVEYIYNESTITTFGTEQTHRWIIEYPTGRFVKIVFTNVSLEKNQDCSDKVLISRTTKNTRAQTIDHRYNERIFVVESSETYLTMTFSPCQMQGKTNRGFRAIITKQDVPACVAKSAVETWIDGKHTCKRPTMMLTSMSILNFPFLPRKEEWEIIVGRHHTIQLHFTEFYIECLPVIGNQRSKFVIIEYISGEKNMFCNSDIPNYAIKSKTEHIGVIFHNNGHNSKIRTEGFRLQYSAVNHSLADITDRVFKRDFFWTVCSETFLRCYSVFTTDDLKARNWDFANFVCRSYGHRLVSVQSKYEMQYINYVLRDHMYRVTWKKMDYTAYIGLRYYNDKKGKKKYIWENTSPVIFSAWRQGHPKEGNHCTRTNFMYNEEDTWESEHCNREIAEWFVCMSQIEGNNDSLLEYVQNCDDNRLPPINVTYSGNVCQRWNMLTEAAKQDFETRFYDQDTLYSSSNYCLNPPLSGIFGCYIEGLNNIWEPCLFQLNEPPLEEIHSGNNRNIDSLPFVCRNGSKISLLKQCDWSFYCNGTSDEISCFYKAKGHRLINTNQSNVIDRLPSRLVKGSYYRCESMEWISILSKCDGVIDCIDASDELHCERINKGF
ncbi:uncharacterized protein LOC128548763 [Mercenaria mercenaria]|uniref:uncharacterized protein LOC128548763 n=1 Tax=Mercenaria mercenaria TaxID=6596 RepID=UPI00234F0210|nr:uncharacterized protein LOC128548763 [Mercenaria mercenaria]